MAVHLRAHRGAAGPATGLVAFRPSPGPVPPQTRVPTRQDGATITFREPPRSPGGKTPTASWLPRRPSALNWLRGLDLNQRPLGYEPIADLHALQRATALHRKNTRLPPPTLAPAV